MMHEYTSLAISTLTVNWTLTFLALLTLLASYLFKYIQGMRLGADDILVLVAFLISTILVSISTWAIVDEGQGNHQNNISASRLEIAAKSLLISEALWTVVTGLLRVAASLLIWTVFTTPSMRLMRFIAIGIMSLSAALGIASVIQIFLICKPFAAQWDPRVLGTCGDQVTSFIMIESAGLLLDIATLALPLKLIMGVRVPLKRRLRVALIVNTGAIVLVITGFRMAALRNAVSPDFTYSQSYLSLLSSAGCMTGVICCSSMTIPRLVSTMKERMLSRWRPSPSPQVDASPETVDNGLMRTDPGLEKGRNDPDLEKGSDSGADTDGGEQLSTHDAVSDSGKRGTPPARITPPGDMVNDAAVALVDSDRVLQDELPLDQGQLFLIHCKYGQAWLLAQNPRTNEIGLVPETSVQLRGSMPWSLDKQAEMNKSFQSYMKCRTESEPQEGSIPS